MSDSERLSIGEQPLIVWKDVPCPGCRAPVRTRGYWRRGDAEETYPPARLCPRCKAKRSREAKRSQPTLFPV